MDNSPLQKLSRELRDEIYALALYVPNGVHVASREYPIRITTPSLRRMRLLALTLACKQIRAESLPLFYAANAFSLDVVAYGDGIDAVKQWQQSLAGPAGSVTLGSLHVIAWSYSEFSGKRYVSKKTTDERMRNCAQKIAALFETGRVTARAVSASSALSAASRDL